MSFYTSNITKETLLLTKWCFHLFKCYAYKTNYISDKLILKTKTLDPFNKRYFKIDQHLARHFVYYVSLPIYAMK